MSGKLLHELTPEELAALKARQEAPPANDKPWDRTDMTPHQALERGLIPGYGPRPR